MKDQYSIIERSAGYVDRGNRGRLRLGGSDAQSFLHGLVSNDVAGLAVGRGCYATYLNPQGRMLAEFDVLRRPDGLLLSMSPGQMPALAERLDQLLFAEDVQIADEGAGWAEYAVLGTEAAARLASAFDLSEGDLSGLVDLSQVDLPDGFVSRATEVAAPMFRVFVPAVEREASATALEGAGIRAITTDLLDALRIEHGRPVWGADLGDDVIPLEAGLLERGISTTKGCYVGQEVVIRILHRGGGRVAKQLVCLVLDTRPEPGTHFVAADGSNIGRVTSIAASPSTDGFVGLGYVSRDHTAVGTVLPIGETGTARVRGVAGG